MRRHPHREHDGRSPPPPRPRPHHKRLHPRPRRLLGFPLEPCYRKNPRFPISLTAPKEIPIEHLYQVFAKYPLRNRIESCPCCRGPQTTRHLHTKPLRELTADDLGTFAFRAMTTVGDADDFRHFLPRIFELLLNGELAEEVDPEIVLGKLAYANWTAWPPAEQSAIRTALEQLWQRHRQTREAETYLCAIARAEPDILPYLNAWEPEAALDFKTDPETKCTGFWKDAEPQWRQVLAWRNQ